MLNQFLTLLLCASSLLGFGQAASVLIDGAGGIEVHNDLQAAISVAQSGDKLYLSGGTHNLDGDDVIIDKTLEIIGAGFDMDTLVATGSTVIRGDLTLINGADNCVLRGFKVEDGLLDIGSGAGSTDDISDLYAELCWFEDGIDFSDSGNGNGPPDLFLIRHCVFGNAAIFYATNVVLQNCLVFGDLTTAYNGVTVDHCLFEDGSSMSIEADNGSFTNNIFHGSSFFSSGESSIFANNIFIDTTPGFDTEDQVENMYISTEMALFGELIDLNFNPDIDYSLLPATVASGNGTDGSDIGHEGGVSPWPQNYLPGIPYIWNESTISNQTDTDGNLPVNIKVSAQGQ
jgi:hypothetical protein